MLSAASVVLPVAGHVAWAWSFMAQAPLRPFSGFEGKHLEI